MWIRRLGRFSVEAKMMHNDIQVTVGVFDTVFRRCEYWRKTLDNLSRDKFYTDALFMRCNDLGKWYPKYRQGEVDSVNKPNMEPGCLQPEAAEKGIERRKFEEGIKEAHEVVEQGGTE